MFIILPDTRTIKIEQNIYLGLCLGQYLFPTYMYVIFHCIPLDEKKLLVKYHHEKYIAFEWDVLL